MPQWRKTWRWRFDGDELLEIGGFKPIVLGILSNLSRKKYVKNAQGKIPWNICILLHTYTWFGWNLDDTSTYINIWYMKPLTCDKKKLIILIRLSWDRTKPSKKKLVGGWTNPFEKYESKWESSPIRGEHKKQLKPQPRDLRVPNEPLTASKFWPQELIWKLNPKSLRVTSHLEVKLGCPTQKKSKLLLWNVHTTQFFLKKLSEDSPRRSFGFCRWSEFC